MAYKPSLRKKTEDLDMDLDIRPVMNLMVVLIPLLLQGAEWVKLGAIEINAPPSKGVGEGSDEQQEQKEEEKRLGLKVAVAKDGITIANAHVILSGEGEEDGPTIPLLPDGEYDYEKMREKLIEIKKKISGQNYRDENRAIVTASRDIEYQTIINVIDNLQTYKDDDVEKPLFPEVNFGSVIQ